MAAPRVYNVQVIIDTRGTIALESHMLLDDISPESETPEPLRKGALGALFQRAFRKSPQPPENKEYRQVALLHAHLVYIQRVTHSLCALLPKSENQLLCFHARA